MNFQLKTVTLAATLAFGLFAATTASAQTYGSYASHQVDVASQLSGNITNNAWVNLSSGTVNGVPGVTGTGGFPGTTMWGPQASQVNTSYGTVSAAELGGATLNKVSNGTGGGPYGASGSLYFGGFSGDFNVNGGTLSVIDSTPLANLATVVLQLGFGEASTYDFFNGLLPTLTVTSAAGVSGPIQATYSQLFEEFDNGTVTMPTGEEPLNINQWGLQWDLTSFTGISNVAFTFTGVQHAQLYGLTLTQSDILTQVVAVPEPETYAMLLAGLGLMGAIARRRRKAQGTGTLAA